MASITMEVGKHIESTDYEPGVSGFRINGDGTYEFNNSGTFRGTVTVDPEVSGNLIELKFDGEDLGRIFTELGVMSINGPGNATAVTFGANEKLTLYAADSLNLFGTPIALNSQPITFGPNDSGGAGYRVVRVPNA